MKPTLASRLSSPISTTPPPSEPRERVHIERKTFSVGDRQYYIDLLNSGNANIVNVERYTDACEKWHTREAEETEHQKASGLSHHLLIRSPAR